MSEVLASLAGRGLILRKAAPDHGRIIRTELTRAGTVVLAACDLAVDELEREIAERSRRTGPRMATAVARHLRAHTRGCLMDNLAALLDEAAARHGSRPALLHEGIAIDYATLQEHATRCAGLLRANGIGPGDRVAILLPNVPAFVAFYFGALRLGAVVVPLNALLKSIEIEQRLADSGATVLVAPPGREAELAACVERRSVRLIDPAFAEAAEPVAEIVACDPSEPAVLLYTSGTTGGPKGAELTHAGLRAAAHCLAVPLLGLTPDDVLFGAAPLAHIFGQSGIMNSAIVAGSCVLLVSRFEPDVSLEQMRETSTTVFLGVPTMVIGLLKAAESATALPPFRVAHSGGAPLPVEVLGAFKARFGCPMLEGYGLTETSGAAVTHHLGQATKPGSAGNARRRRGRAHRR